MALLPIMATAAAGAADPGGKDGVDSYLVLVSDDLCDLAAVLVDMHWHVVSQQLSHCDSAFKCAARLATNNPYYDKRLSAHNPSIGNKLVFQITRQTCRNHCMSTLLGLQKRLPLPCRTLSRSKRVCRSLSSNSVDLSSRSSVTYINRPVRADEHVEAPGSVVVHGDVAADASISAAGDVMVWGR